MLVLGERFMLLTGEDELADKQVLQALYLDRLPLMLPSVKAKSPCCLSTQLKLGSTSTVCQKLVKLRQDDDLRIIRVIASGKQDMSRPDRAAEVVHMPVGVLVCIQAQGQPDDLLGCQRPAQLSLDLLLGHVGILILLQQALIGHQQCPASHWSPWWLSEGS